MSKKTIIIDTSGSDSYFITSFGQRINKSTYLSFINSYAQVDKNCELTIEISSEGGSPFYSMLIANIILNHKGFTTARVNCIALCGATLIALMCDKLIINENAVLSPINRDLYVPSLNQLEPNGFFSCFSIITDKYTAISSKQVEKLFIAKYNRVHDSAKKLKTVDDYVSTLMDIFCSKDSECIPLFSRDLPPVYLYLEITEFNKNECDTSDNEIIDYNIHRRKKELAKNLTKKMNNCNEQLSKYMNDKYIGDNMSNTEIIQDKTKLNFNGLNFLNQQYPESDNYISSVYSDSDSE